MPGAGFGGGIQNKPVGGGYGASFKDDQRKYYGATVGFSGRGEMIPNADSYCEIDPTTVDKWGIPVLRFHWKWADYEIKQAKHMQETFRSIIVAMGGTPNGDMPGPERMYGLSTGGSIIHELGGVRMGSDAGSSVLNANCQAHEVKNVFCTDGGPFVSQADKNPTWTILALSMRASEFIAAEMKNGGL
jgi:choline dehydrogenase-like flavoprotein